MKANAIGAAILILVLFASAIVSFAQAPAAPSTQPAAHDGDPMLSLPRPPTSRSVETAHVPAVIVQLEDEINDYSRDDLIRRFREAREQGAKAIVLEINSYGGSALAGLETSRFIKQQTDLKVMAFVKEKAISAGALIAVACDGIWMAPHSFIGDAGVIAMSSSGVQELGTVERAKAESPVVEDFRDSAVRNGYSSLLLESMVVVGREVYFIQDAQGRKQLVDGEKYQQLSKEGWTPVIPDRNPIDSKESLLTLNAAVAHQIGLAKQIVNTPEDVAEKLGWTVIARLDRTAGDRLVALLSSMGVRALLMIILMISIYLAVQSPGLGIPEAAIAVCLGLLMGVPLLTGYAQWWEIFLVLLGVALLALEIFVIPGFGLAGITGLLAIIAGLVMTFVPREPIEIPGILPGLQGSWIALQQGFVVVIISLMVATGTCFVLARYIQRVPLFSKLVLTATVGGGQADTDYAAEDPTAVASIPWVTLGATGTTLTDLRPGGTAQFHDPALNGVRNLDVVCDSGFIPAGSSVLVHEIQGSTVVVRKMA